MMTMMMIKRKLYFVGFILLCGHYFSAGVKDPLSTMDFKLAVSIDLDSEKTEEGSERVSDLIKKDEIAKSQLDDVEMQSEAFNEDGTPKLLLDLYDREKNGSGQEFYILKPGARMHKFAQGLLVQIAAFRPNECLFAQQSKWGENYAFWHHRFDCEELKKALAARKICE